MQPECPTCKHTVGLEQERCFICRSRLHPAVKLVGKKKRKKNRPVPPTVGTAMGLVILSIFLLIFIGSYVSTTHTKPVENTTVSNKTQD